MDIIISCFVCLLPGFLQVLPTGKAPSSGALDLGITSGLSHASDLKASALVTTLPGARFYGVSARTGWPGVNNML